MFERNRLGRLTRLQARFRSRRTGSMLLQARPSTTSPWHALFCRRQGLPDCHGAGAPVRKVHAGRVRHPDGQTDRRPRRRGRAAGTPAGTIRMPPVSRSGSGPQMDASPGSSSGPEPGGPVPGKAEAEPGCRSPGRQGAGRCGRPDRPSSYSGITLSDEGGLKRTHADPPMRGHRLLGAHRLRRADQVDRP
jgi:hypothetical protein